MFLDYYAHPEFLWRGDPSDRNEHFTLGLTLAIAAKNIDLDWYLYLLEFAKLWPPFHGIVLSMVLLLGGLDIRLGIVPSLFGWIITITMTWVIARRYFQNTLLSIFASSIATTFAIGSPLFRLFATDVMLECLGAALTSVVLYTFMRTYSEPDNPVRWRLLALFLTALFFEKYNYWGLTTIALLVSILAQAPYKWFGRTRSDATLGLDYRTIARQIAIDPVVMVVIGLVFFIVYIQWRGPTEIYIFEQHINFYPPDNLTSIAYAILFFRLCLAWYRHRPAIDAALGVSGRTMLYWHVLPVAISFLVPRRLSWFLWVGSPENTFGEHHDPWNAIFEYSRGLADGIFVGPWAAGLAFVLFLIATTKIRSLKPEFRTPLIFVLVCGLATILHPNHQPRFMVTWIFGLWIGAGVGGAYLLQWTIAPLKSDCARIGIASALIGFLIGGTILQRPSPAAASYAHRTPGPSEFDLLPAYLPQLAGHHHIGLLPAPFGKTAFLFWNVSMHCHCRIAMDWLGNLTGLGEQEFENRLRNWLANTDSDIIVGISMPNSPVPEEWIDLVMKSQARFEIISNRTAVTHQAVVTVWQKRH